jgi:hypothetical protein
MFHYEGFTVVSPDAPILVIDAISGEMWCMPVTDEAGKF